MLFDAGDILYFRPDKLGKLIQFLDELGINKEVVNCEEGKNLKLKALKVKSTAVNIRKHY